MNRVTIDDVEYYYGRSLAECLERAVAAKKARAE